MRSIPQAAKFHVFLTNSRKVTKCHLTGQLASLFTWVTVNFCESAKINRNTTDMVNYMSWEPVKYSEVNYIVGGTGITPTYQVLLSAAMNEDKKTKFNLIFCNKTENDMLLKSELKELENKINLKTTFLVDCPKEGAIRLQTDLVREAFGKPKENSLLYFCGNNKMKEKVTEINEALGFKHTYGL